MVRREDDRSRALREAGAEVVVGDLRSARDVGRAVRGCSRVYFGMGVGEDYLEAALVMAAVAKHHGVELLVNISQMTVSRMNLHETTKSKQQQHHWLVEQVFDWSGLPVVHLRPTVFLEHPFFSLFAVQTIARSNELRLPFGSGRTSPVAAQDVAHAAATILSARDPRQHAGKVYELTGPTAQDLHAIAAELGAALQREIRYVEVPLEQWIQVDLATQGLPPHLTNHLATMAELHHDNFYDRFSADFARLTGKEPMTIGQWATANAHLFKSHS